MNSFTKCVFFLILAYISTSFAEDCSFDNCDDDAPVRVMHKNSLPDKASTLKVTYECKNGEGIVVYKCETEEKNPYGPNVQVQNYSYRGSYVKHYSSGPDVSNTNEVNIKEQNEVESFD